jgi:hypothetical protein
MEQIYVLKLEFGKYYVGKTGNVDVRIHSHVNGRGSAWTRIHSVVEHVETRDCTGKFDEDMCTLEYMDKYGIENVRGGSFCQIQLTDGTVDTIERILSHANNRCFSCGGKDHYIGDCPRGSTPLRGFWQRLKNFIHMILTTPSYDDVGRDTGVVCYRCGRGGHYSTECYARYSIGGEVLGYWSDSSSDDA